MTSRTRPVVERVTPPKAPFVLVNAVMRTLLSSRRGSSGVGRRLLLLHLVGRRSGRPLTVPVAYRDVGDGRLLVLTNSRWRFNLRDRDRVEVTFLGRRQQAHAQLVEDPRVVAEVYDTLITEVGYRRAGRRMGIRINVDRLPTVEELADAARRDGLSLVYLRLDSEQTR